MSQNTRSSNPIPIPIELWESSKLELKSKNNILYNEQQQQPPTKRQKTNNRGRRRNGVLIRHFTYNLNNEQFITCNIQHVSNLFFEYTIKVDEDNVSDDYIIIQMDDTYNEDRLLDANDKNDDHRGSSNRTSRDYFSFQVDNRRENVLRNGVCGFEDGEEVIANTGSLVYNLIGCSNSQVQRHHYVFRKCISLQGNQTHLQLLLPNLKELEVKKGAPKRVKYTGLLFSGITPVQLPPDVIVEEIESKIHNGFDFTDGPGLISKKLAFCVKEQLGIQGECPSVFQIRYCGRVSRLHGKNKRNYFYNSTKKNGYVCKGILVVNPEDDSMRIQVRASMLKVESSAMACDVLQYTLGVCEYSKGALVGRLGSQLVCLLSHAMNDDDLLQLQNEYLHNLSKSSQDPINMAWVLALDTKPKTWKDFTHILHEEYRIKEEDNDDPPRQYIQCVKAVESGRHLPKSDKVQIPLAASRTLFGAVIPEYLHETLNENECIVLLEDGPLSPTRIDPKNIGENADAFVVVTRSPAYYPGDIRVLKVVTPSPGSPIGKLRNCILFSTQGNRPEPDKMGGGDLDGDMYLVIWHPTILKYVKTLKEFPPADYDVASRRGHGSIVEHDWIHYAALTDNGMLAEVESTFYRIAKKYGVKSTELKQLNALFASLVDRNPTSLEEFRKLKNSVPIDVSVIKDECIWEVMTERQRSVIKSLKGKNTQNTSLSQLIPYLKFQRKVHAYTENPSLFITSIQQQYWYHFLNSPRRIYIEHTIKSFELKQCKQMLLKCSIKQPSATVSPSVESPTFIKQVTQEEKIFFEKLEARTKTLFNRHLDAMEKYNDSLEKVFAEHLRRKNTIISSRDSEIGSIRDMIRAEEMSWHCNMTNLQNLATQLSLCEKRYNVLLDGTEKKRLESLRNDMNQELQFLHQDLMSFNRRINDKQQVLTRMEEIKKDCEDTYDRIDTSNMDWELDTFRCCGNLVMQQLKSMLSSFAIPDPTNSTLQLVQKLGKILLECIGRLIDMKQPEIALVDKLSSTRKLLAGKTRSILIKTLNPPGKALELVATQKKVTKGKHDSSILVLLDKFIVSLCAFERDCISDCIQHLVQDLELLKTQRYEVGYKVGEIKTKVGSIKAEISRMFCPEKLLDVEEKLGELKGKQENLLFSRGRIQRNIEKSRQKWEEDIINGLSSNSQRNLLWKSVQVKLTRIYTLEENRLLGFPREGNKRSGPLPVYFKRAELQRLLDTSRAVVVTAGTGTGKSTQLPQYIADYYLDRYTSEGNAKQVRICCTQPRRVAAQKIAKRVAAEYQTKVGELVGFRVGRRGHSITESKQTGKDTIIEFVTEGLLLFNLAKSGDFIKNYDCIIIDEMHERNAEQDWCLALLREYLKKCISSHPSFKVVIMSATIDSSQFCAYFNDCPTMNCHGRCFPVEEEYIPPPEEGNLSIVSHAVNVLFDEIVSKHGSIDGDVLIFLSGSKDINDCVNAIRAKASETSPVVAYPLYSRLDQESINAATNPDHRTGLVGGTKEMTTRRASTFQGVRKVICATNIAETSLTIDRVKFVIDSGRVRKVSYNHTIKCSTLNEEWTSKASTKQRRGRAGRTGPGQCYYLFSQEFHSNEMADYDKPKILEKPVDEQILLSLNLCGKSVEEADLLDTPQNEDILAAKERLLDLDLIELDKNNNSAINLTESGRVASSLPFLRPESVRMILNACTKYPQCVPKVIKLAVVMSSLIDGRFDGNLDSDEFITHFHVYGDHLRMLNNLDWFEEGLNSESWNNTSSFESLCLDHGLDFALFKDTLDDVDSCHKELKRRGLLPPQAERGISEDESVLRVLISGYFHHIVECLDPDYIHKTKCTLLTDHSIQLSLGRESCLQNALVIQNENILVDDDNKVLQSSSPDSLNDERIQNIQKEAVDPSYLLYGGLSCYANPNGRLNLYMQDCSVIEGTWIRGVTPARWLDRVQSDTERRSLCRITIKNVGASILNECKRSKLSTEDITNNAEGCIDFFELMKRHSKVDSIIYDYNNCFVRITGTQTAVEVAKTSISKELDVLIQKQHRNTKNNVRARICNVEREFQSGMTIHRSNMNFCAFAVDQIKFYPNSEIISLSVDKKKQAVVIYQRGTWPINLIKHCIECISELKIGQVTKEKWKLLVNFKPSDIAGEGAAWVDAANFVVSLLKCHEVFATDYRSIKSFESNGIMLGALCHEAVKDSKFWNGFRQSLVSVHELQADVIFVPSQKSFVFGGPDRGKLAEKFAGEISALSERAKNYHALEFSPECPPERYQLRRFASIFCEVKIRFQDVMFHLDIKTRTTNDHKENNEVDLNGSFEYTWLMDISNRHKIASIRINFVGLNAKTEEKVSKDLEANLNARTLLEDSLPEVNTNDSRHFEIKKCVMCRRFVFICFGKGVGIENKLRNNGQDLLAGRTLTMCGCAYCRECFRHGVSECLSSSLYCKKAKCLNCKKIVLAKDCNAIFWLNSKAEVKDQYVREWLQFCCLAEASHCATNMKTLAEKGGSAKRRGICNRQPGCHVCPDCGVAMVFPRGYKFFKCRTSFCPNTFCTRCRLVVTSEDSAQKCYRDECLQYSN